MQDNELQVEYSMSLNSSPCNDFLSGEIDRGDNHNDYGLLAEMSAPYSDGKDPEMNLFDKPLGMDDFSIDIRSDLYQSLGPVGNGDDTNTGDSDNTQELDLIQDVKKSQGPKAKKVKLTSSSESVNNNLQDGGPSIVVPESSVINREKKVHKTSQGGKRVPPKSRNNRKGTRLQKNSKVSQKFPGEGSDSEDNSHCSVLANGSSGTEVTDGLPNDLIQIESDFVGSNSQAETQNVIVHMEPTLNMNSELSINSVQAIRDEFSDLHNDASVIEEEAVEYGSPDEVSGYLNSQVIHTEVTTNHTEVTTHHTEVTIVQSPSTSTQPVATTSNMVLTSTPNLVNSADSDKHIILNANVLNQGTEKNVSYVMVPVSLVQQFQAANPASVSASTSTAGSSTTSALMQRPQIVQLLNENYGYVCHVCRYSGKMPYLLENHMKTCHLPHRPYICLGCYKAFNLRGTALCHIRLKHLEAGTQMMIDQDMEGLQAIECQKLMQLIFRCHVCDSVGKYMSGLNNKPKNLNPHLFVCKMHAEVQASQ